MSDFDSLDLPCLPGMGCPCRESERAAIVAWLREPQGESVTPWCELLADFIERGDHLGGDDE